MLPWAAHFRTAIIQQENVGYLFPHLPKGRIQQNADYLWQHDGGLWIGDAKYKHLTKDQASALKFAELPDSEDAQPGETTLAGHVLSATDVRQLTVYSELAKGKYSRKTTKSVDAALPIYRCRFRNLYPTARRVE